MLTEILQVRGQSELLTGIYAMAPHGGDIARHPSQAHGELIATCQRAVKEGAQAIVLGGIGLLGLAEEIADHVDVPLLCSTKAGFRGVSRQLALGQATLAIQPSRVESIGLSSALSALLSGGPV